ncbi:MAG: hypothetical protein ACFCUS_08710 [Rubrimonas sp.]|uniref:hypothetical protein n=1 Tax=Rubrimonas sp. TaxID=2036015 RepID=UPI002FDEA58C
MRAILMALALLLWAGAAPAEQEGYYYPPITSSEVFARTLAEAPPAGREERIAFVTQFTREQLGLGYAPRYALLAKGAEAQELIVVSLDDAVFRTLFRARAVMAQLSAPARMTEFFTRNQVADVATFYDMLKLMGFRNLTLSDGATWSHRVDFE